MAEFLKLPVLNAGVGQYQHSLSDANDTKLLKRQLEDVAREIVGVSGVDVNNDQASILAYIPGITKSTVEKIVRHRTDNVIETREDLLTIGGIGKKTYDLINGYCRTDRRGLDETLVSTSDYAVARSILSKIGVNAKKLGSQVNWKEDVWSKVEALKKENQQNVDPEAAGAAAAAVCLGWDWEQGEETVFRILMETCRPQQEEADFIGVPLPEAVRKDLTKLKGGESGVAGVISNVTDFGTFVDIGCKRQGLVHRSKGRGGGVGEKVVVDIFAVDLERGRIELGWGGSSKNEEQLRQAIRAGGGGGEGGRGGRGESKKRKAGEEEREELEGRREKGGSSSSSSKKPAMKKKKEKKQKREKEERVADAGGSANDAIEID